MNKITVIKTEFGTLKKGQWQSGGGMWYGICHGGRPDMDFLTQEVWEKLAYPGLPPEIDPLPF